MSQAREQCTQSQAVKDQKYAGKERSCDDGEIDRRVGLRLGPSCEGPCISHVREFVWVLSEIPCKFIEKLLWGWGLA